MTHWRNTMVDRPETDGVTGWTISGLAVLAAVVAVWVFGIIRSNHLVIAECASIAPN